MSTARQNRQDTPIWALLTAVSLVVVILSFVHFRHSLPATHDVGFTVPLPSKITKDSQRGSRSIVSSDGQFMTLDPSGRFLMNSITKKPVFITGDAPWSLITQLVNSDLEVYLLDRASR